MSDRLGVGIPVMELAESSGLSSLEEIFDDDAVEWMEDTDAQLARRKLERELELLDTREDSSQIDIDAQIEEVRQELKELGDGEIPNIENLSESDKERYDNLRSRLQRLEQFENVKTYAAMDSLAASVPPEAIEVGLTLSENVTSGLVATYLYNRLSERDIDKVKIGRETIQPVTREQLKEQIERVRSKQNNDS